MEYSLKIYHRQRNNLNKYLPKSSVETRGMLEYLCVIIIICAITNKGKNQTYVKRISWIVD